jgi:hypothetical protein
MLCGGYDAERVLNVDEDARIAVVDRRVIAFCTREVEWAALAVACEQIA